MIKSATLWLLITITGTGDVHHREFHNQRGCDEAKSMALYGQTLEQIAVAQKRVDNAKKEWDAKHPPHKPTPEQQKDIDAGYAGKSNWMWDKKTGLVTESYAFDDCAGFGFSYDSSREFIAPNAVGCGIRIKENYDVKNAECINEYVGPK